MRAELGAEQGQEDAVWGPRGRCEVGAGVEQGQGLGLSTPWDNWKLVLMLAYLISPQQEGSKEWIVTFRIQQYTVTIQS